MSKVRCVRALAFVFGVLAGLSGCSEQDVQPRYSLVADDNRDEGDRLRKMQMVRTLTVDGDTTQASEMPATDLRDDLETMCQRERDCLNTYQFQPCHQLACNGIVNLCVANYLTEIAGIRATPFKISLVNPSNPNGPPLTEYFIPTQSNATNSALAQVAMQAASKAIDLVGGGIASALELPGSSNECTEGRLAEVHNADQSTQTVGSTLSEVYASAYRTLRDAAFAASDAVLAVADSQRGQGSITEQVSRAVTGLELSRAAAGHLLVGGEAGLGINATAAPRAGVCTAGRLSGGAQRALDVLRSSGLSPNDVLAAPVTGQAGGGILIGTLLNGTLPALSVKERLTIIEDRPLGEIQAEFGLETQDFVEAREYLAEEILAFSRSRTATEPVRPFAEGSAATLRMYVGTRRPPLPRPPVFYSTLLRHSDTVFAQDSVLNHPDLAGKLNAALGLAGQLVKNEAELVSADVKKAVFTPLAALLAKKEREGLIVLEGSSPNQTQTRCQTLKFKAWGYSTEEHLKIVIGEDGLLCATEGTIEGALCHGANGDIDGQYVLGAINVAATPTDTTLQTGRGFSVGVQASFTIPAQIPFPSRYYVVKPIDPNRSAPGAFRALSGVTALPELCVGFVPELADAPVEPELDKLAADIMQPSRKWCTVNQVTCAGTDFDERLPLEDELTSDGDSVESSWKHYLELARQAAEESHALGEAYIAGALALDQRLESDDIRKEDQEKLAREHALAAISELKLVCGVEIDSVRLLKFLSGVGDDATPEELDAALIRQNGQTARCDDDLDCVDPGNPVGTSAYECIMGACIVNFAELAKENGNDPEFLRLYECLRDDNVGVPVHMGSPGRPLCYWQDPGDLGSICTGASPTYPCPRLAEPGATSCPDTIRPPAPAAGSDAIVKVAAEGLNEIATKDMPSVPTGAAFDPCNALRQAQPGSAGGRRLPRSGLAATQDELVARIRHSRVFDTANVEKTVPRLSFEARFGSYAAILVDGKPVYTTGSIEDGPNDEWPCTAPRVGTTGCTLNAQGQVVPGDDQPLFCDFANCSVKEQRARLNSRMLRAVVGADLIGGRASTGGIVYPTARPEGQVVDEMEVQTNQAVGVTGSIRQALPRVDGDVSPGRTYVVSAAQQAAGLTSFLTRDGETIAPLQKPLFIPYKLAFEKKPDSSYYLGGLSTTSPAESGFFLKELRGVHTDPGGGVGAVTLDFAFPIVREGDSNQGFALPLIDGEGTRPDPPETGDDEQEGAANDGGELVCDIQAQPCDPANPPVVSTLGELPKLEWYMGCLAGYTEHAAATTFFPSLPSEVLRALQSNIGVIGGPGSLGGDAGVNVGELRKALVDMGQLPRRMGSALRSYGRAVNQLQIDLRRVDGNAVLGNLERLSTLSREESACAAASAPTVGASVGWSCAGPSASVSVSYNLGAADICANSRVQAGLANSKFTAQELLLGLDKEQAFLDFQQRTADLVDAIADETTRAKDAQITANTQMALIRAGKLRARSLVSDALTTDSFESKRFVRINSAMYRRMQTDKLRYNKAFKAAQRMAFLAKRAIETRLGVTLAELTEPLPLVDAPSQWESQVCHSTGLDYQRFVTNPIEGLDPSVPSPGAGNFADAYIGDYVKKLENLVESYRLVNSFHEGRDVAVISLREDVLNTRRDCPVTVNNLLYHAGEIGRAPYLETPGWERVGCRTETVAGEVRNKEDCVAVTAQDAFQLEAALPELSGSSAYRLRFGTAADGVNCPSCGYQQGAKLVQKVKLSQGRYRFSWYHRAVGATEAATGPGVVAVDAADADAIVNLGNERKFEVTTEWRRVFRIFDVKRDVVANVGFGVPMSGAATPAPIAEYLVAAPMLESVLLSNEQLAAADTDVAPPPFANTGSELTRLLPVCEDTDGAVFRSRWRQDSVRLCSDGFTGECPDADAKQFGFWETNFRLNQADIEAGRAFKNAGFAQGNFNYRINSVAINVVGTGVKDCSAADSPSTCGSNGGLPFTLVHDGPYLIRNHEGRDFEAKLFPGRIENARALAIERYVTNPISSADRELLQDYIRAEFQGRPMDGNFELRVWKSEDLRFEAIQDVQIILDYSYWTRFE